jgi:hypothetical protein
MHCTYYQPTSDQAPQCGWCERFHINIDPERKVCRLCLTDENFRQTMEKRLGHFAKPCKYAPKELRTIKLGSGCSGCKSVKVGTCKKLGWEVFTSRCSPIHCEEYKETEE